MNILKDKLIITSKINPADIYFAAACMIIGALFGAIYVIYEARLV